MNPHLMGYCPRCGRDGAGAEAHPGIYFVAMRRPLVADGHVFTHWALCPVTFDPILRAGPGPEQTAKPCPGCNERCHQCSEGALD